VGERAEPERDPFDPFDEVVRRFSGSVAGAAVVPVQDLGPPRGQHLGERADLRRLDLVASVIDEVIEVRLRLGGVAELVIAA